MALRAAAGTDPWSCSGTTGPRAFTCGSQAAGRGVDTHKPSISSGKCVGPGNPCFHKGDVFLQLHFLGWWETGGVCMCFYVG